LRPSAYVRSQVARSTLRCCIFDAATNAVIGEPREREVKDDDRYVFEATCPQCGQIATQERRRSDLRQSLAGEADISAYCIKCDAHWKLSEEERDRLAHNFMLE
jgi:hypothetical protein